MPIDHVAIITPYVGEDASIIARSTASIAAQLCPGVRVTQVLVSDGAPFPDLPTPSGALSELHAIRLPAKTGDGGSTPRAVGSAFVIGRYGVGGIGFLDVDNTFTPDHVATMVALAGDSADLISAKRWLCHLDTGAHLKEDTTDSDGMEFTDPSCIFVANRAVRLARLWGDPDPTGVSKHNTMQDRHYWELLKRHVEPGRHRIATHPTVEYRTPWIAHYFPGVHTPPKRAKVLSRQPDGSLKSVWVEVLGPEGDDGWRLGVSDY